METNKTLTLSEVVARRYVPTYQELVRMEVDGIECWWVEQLLYGWNEKRWTIPKLPKLEDRTLLIRQKLPHLTNKDINEIVKEANKVLRDIKKNGW